MFIDPRKTLVKEYHELCMKNNTETRKNKHIKENSERNQK